MFPNTDNTYRNLHCASPFKKLHQEKTIMTSNKIICKDKFFMFNNRIDKMKIR